MCGRPEEEELVVGANLQVLRLLIGGVVLPRMGKRLTWEI